MPYLSYLSKYSWKKHYSNILQMGLKVLGLREEEVAVMWREFLWLKYTCLLLQHMVGPMWLSLTEVSWWRYQLGSLGQPERILTVMIWCLTLSIGLKSITEVHLTSVFRITTTFDIKQDSMSQWKSISFGISFTRTKCYRPNINLIILQHPRLLKQTQKRISSFIS